MVVYAYQRTKLYYTGKEEVLIDFSTNLEELLEMHREEKIRWQYSDFSFLQGNLSQLMEIKVRDR